MPPSYHVLFKIKPKDTVHWAVVNIMFLAWNGRYSSESGYHRRTNTLMAFGGYLGNIFVSVDQIHSESEMKEAYSE